MVLAGALSLLGACADPEEFDPADNLPLMPLAVGNLWELVAHITSDGDTVLVDTLRIELVGTVAPPSGAYFTRSSGLPFTEALAFAMVGDSVSVAGYDEDSDALSDFELLLRYPVAPTGGYFYTTPHVADFPTIAIRPTVDTLETGLGPLARMNYAVGAPLSIEFGFSPGIGLISMKTRIGTYVLHSLSLVGPSTGPTEVEPNSGLHAAAGALRACACSAR